MNNRHLNWVGAWLVVLVIAACGGGGVVDPGPGPGPDPGPGPGPTPTYTLTGTVRNSAAQPISGAVVLLGARTTVTGTAGSYSFDNLAQGGYTISLQAPAGDFDCRSIVISATQTVYDFTLPNPAGGFRVRQVQPPLGQTAAPLDTTITLDCGAAVDLTNLLSADFKFTPDIGPFDVSASGNLIIITPEQQLALDRNVTAEVVGEVRSASKLLLPRPVRWTFRTASVDAFAPRLVNTAPPTGSPNVARNQTIVYTFTEPLAVNQTALQLSSDPAATLTSSVSGSSLRISASGGWLPATSYRLSVANVTDTSGNATSALPTLEFTTGTQSVTAHNASADWNRVANIIVFASDRDGSYDIWSIKPDGTGLTQLTSLPSDELHPTLSSDGTRLAFQRAALDGKQDIYAASLSGGVLGAPLLLTPPQSSDYAPYYSRTPSNLLVFVTDRTGRQELYTMNDDGSSPVELDLAFNTASLEPQLHPLLDGQLLFTSYNGDKRNIWRKSVSIVDGSTVNTLLTGSRSSDDHSPAWGPDASFIVFISDFDGTPNLWQAEANGDFPRQVTAYALPQAASDPCVSPVSGDNSCLISVARTDGGSDLVIVDLLSGAIVRNLTSTDGLQP